MPPSPRSPRWPRNGFAHNDRPATPTLRRDADRALGVRYHRLHLSATTHTPFAALMTSAARSPITMHGAMVLPVVMRGMIEPSATRRRSTPYTLRLLSTTLIASVPILAVQVW